MRRRENYNEESREVKIGNAGPDDCDVWCSSGVERLRELRGNGMLTMVCWCREPLSRGALDGVSARCVKLT